MPLKKLLDRAMERGGVVFYGDSIATYEVLGNKAWIQPVWVHPRCRRMGTGTHLIELIGRDAYSKGAKRLCAKTMSDRPDAAGMLRKAGMTAIRETKEFTLWQNELEELVGRWDSSAA